MTYRERVSLLLAGLGAATLVAAAVLAAGPVAGLAATGGLLLLLGVLLGLDTTPRPVELGTLLDPTYAPDEHTDRIEHQGPDVHVPAAYRWPAA